MLYVLFTNTAWYRLCSVAAVCLLNDKKWLRKSCDQSPTLTLEWFLSDGWLLLSGILKHQSWCTTRFHHYREHIGTTTRVQIAVEFPLKLGCAKGGCRPAYKSGTPDRSRRTWVDRERIPLVFRATTSCLSTTCGGPTSARSSWEALTSEEPTHHEIRSQFWTKG